jgi:hypothetical protein
MDAWIRDEVNGCDLGDRRLDQRLGRLLGDLSERIGKGIPLASQDWAATKAAYRFLDNAKVNESSILQGHFQATAARFADTSGLVLVLHDTTEFSYRREHPQAIGKTHKIVAGAHGDGRPRMHTICGLLLHSSLVVTPDGLPLGLAAARFWTRKKFKGTNALKRKINLTRVPIEEKESCRWVQNLQQATDLLGEPERCVHIGDRESDIYELFCAAQQANTHFLVRTCVDRLAESGDTTIAQEMENAERGVHVVELTDDRGKTFKAKLEVRFRRMTVRPPIGKQKQYSALSLTVIHAREINCPKNRKPIEWKLLTDLPVTCLADTTEKLDWYATRWKIEMFHKVLKSGCRAEDARLRTAQRLTNLLAIYCIVSWRVFWMCMINRTSPEAPAALVFTDTEMQLLDHADPKPSPAAKKTVSHYLYAVARLGGYLSRVSDPPPGNMVLWRGFTRLIDIQLGFSLGAKLVGN